MSLRGAGLLEIDAIARYQALIALDLDGNALRSLAPLSALPCLEELSLRENALRVLNAEYFPRLVHLSVAANDLESLENLHCLTRLERLDCAGNRLAALDVRPLARLQHLNCGYNRIEQLLLGDALRICSCASNLLRELAIPPLLT